MNYNEYITTIVNSNIQEWQYDDERGSYLYLPDISIMMQNKIEDESKDFYEPWIEKYSNAKAYVHVVELYYEGMRVDDFYTAAVDGYRMCIPYPKKDGMTITYNQYSIGKIINIPYMSNNIFNYDGYLEQAGITVLNK